MRPLTKEKIGEGIFENKYVYEGHSNRLLLVDDVKSAVQWLLKEIEKEFSRYRESGSNLEESVKTKIKKAFEGVME